MKTTGKLKQCLMICLIFCLSLPAAVRGEDAPSGEEDQIQSPCYMYFLNEDQTALVRAEFIVNYTTPEELLQSLMLRLNEIGTEEGLTRLLPENVRIEAYSLGDTELDLQMSGEYVLMDPGREVLVRAGLVYTLVQVQGIDKVRIFVEDEELKDESGQPLGQMDGDSFTEVSEDFQTFRYESFQLYFTDKEGKELLPETRNVYYRQDIPRERVLLEQLIKGPMEPDHYPTLPEKTTVNGISVFGDVCRVDVSTAFIDYALSIPAMTAIRSVVRSLTENGSSTLIQISVDGDEFRTMGEDEISLYRYFDAES